MDPLFVNPAPPDALHPRLKGVLPQPRLPAADFPVVSDNMLVLADKVARNREIAGLHFETDSAAGKTLADLVAPLLSPLLTTAAAPFTVDTITAAGNEWP